MSVIIYIWYPRYTLKILKSSALNAVIARNVGHVSMQINDTYISHRPLIEEDDLELIDMKLWKIWERAMKTAFERPAFRKCWELVRNHTVYPPSFTEFVNNKLIASHHTYVSQVKAVR